MPWEFVRAERYGTKKSGKLPAIGMHTNSQRLMSEQNLKWLYFRSLRDEE
jgi:hypothetical protein